MQLTRHELRDHAEFVNDSSFQLKECPFKSKVGEIPVGLYELPRRSGDAHLYRLNHPLAEAIVAQSKDRQLPIQQVRFAYGEHNGKVSVLKPLIGKSGWLTLSQFSVESLDQAEDHLIFTAVTDEGMTLDEDAVARLFTLPGQVGQQIFAAPCVDALDAHTSERQAAIKRTISERNARFFEAEAEKLDGWADDIKLGLEREIKELDRQIKEARRAATLAPTLEEKLAGQKQIKALESQRKEKRWSLFEAQDKVDQQREHLIAQIEGKLTLKSGVQQLFTLRWSVAGKDL
jgi:adenine-specific DNA-methyltransferase